MKLYQMFICYYMLNGLELIAVTRSARHWWPAKRANAVNFGSYAFCILSLQNKHFLTGALRAKFLADLGFQISDQYSFF